MKYSNVLFAAILATSMAVTAPGQKAPEGAISPFITDILGQADFVEGRILSLNNAMAGKEAWRPAADIRSVGETYLHIAFGNYILLKQAGFEPPAAANFSMDMKKWDSQETKAAKIADILKASFAHVRDAAGKVTPEQLEKKIDLFGHEMTTRNVFITVLNHMHEHLGQSIAYARMNSVVPPWTAAEQAAAKAKPEKTSE